MVEHINNVYDLITEEEKGYQQPIDVEDGWSWNMKEHLRRSFLYLNGQFEENNDDRTLRPNKNIVLPILNVQFRTEGFDVKDIELFVDNPDEHYKSLLVKKYHTKWALEQEIDTFIDEMTEGYCTYGGVLVRKTGKARPDVVDLRTLAFADQVNILAHPFGIKHEFSPSQLRTENPKWDKDAIETVISLGRKEGDKKLEVYEVHGLMPKEWLDNNDPEDLDEDGEYVNQVQVVSFYMDSEGQKRGITLFSNKEPKLPFKFLSRDEVEGRALGRGGVEELFESQVWTNWDEIKITEMLDAAAKTIHFSDDQTISTRNNLSDVDNGEILKVQEGKTIQQVDTFPRNLQVFNDSVVRWQNQAQLVGAASDPLLGETPSSGTPFKLFEAQQIEAQGMHKYRQGKLAVFMDEIYRDWIIPHLAKEIVKEQNFMQELSSDEIEMVINKVIDNKTNNFKKEMILSGQEINDELVTDFKNTVREEEIKRGNKRFLKILQDEMKGDDLGVMTNIAGKQKNLALLTDKLVNVLRQYIATPQIRQDPEMTKLLNTILESSGLSPIMFGPAPAQAIQAPQQGGGGTEPLQDLSQANQQTNA